VMGWDTGQTVAISRFCRCFVVASPDSVEFEVGKVREEESR